MKKFFGFALTLSVSLFTFLIMGNTHAFAATRTWDGDGANDKWTTDANWSGDAAPGSGDDAIIPDSVTGVTFDTDGIEVGSITINGADNIFTGSITVNGNITVNASTNFGIDATPDVEFTLTMADTDKIIFNTETYNRVLTDFGADFEGDIELNGIAQLWFRGSDYLREVNSVTVNDDASVEFKANLATATIVAPIILNGDGREVTWNSLGYVNTTFYYASLKIYSEQTNADITINSITLGANATYNSDMYADGKVTVSTLTKNGHTLTRVPGSGGRLIVDGTDVSKTYNNITISLNDDEDTEEYEIPDMLKILLTGSRPNKPFVVLKGGIIGGTGAVGAVTVENGGKIAPGLSPGCLSTGNLTFETGGIYDFEVGGTTACTNYDQIKVTGTVALANGTLNLLTYNNFKPSKDQTYTIIDNDASDAVTGTFKDLAEGATFTVNGYVYKISYKGGDGNDVVISVVSVPATPDTGFAVLSNPLTLALTTTAFAGAIFAIARKTKFLSR